MTELAEAELTDGQGIGGVKKGGASEFTSESQRAGRPRENHCRELKAIAARSGWQVVGLYEDVKSTDYPGRSA
jgi:hypothetical protein